MSEGWGLTATVVHFFGLVVGTECSELRRHRSRLKLSCLSPLGRKVVSLHMLSPLGRNNFRVHRLWTSAWKLVRHANNARAPGLGNMLPMWSSKSLVGMLRAASLSKLAIEPPWIAHCCFGVNFTLVLVFVHLRCICLPTTVNAGA